MRWALIVVSHALSALSAAAVMSSPALAGGASDQARLGRSLIARTAYFEARSDGAAGMQAVAFVVVNRLNDGSFGDSAAAVVHQPAQFSVWNRGGAARRGKIPRDDPHYRLALRAASRALAGAIDDPSRGALYFHGRRIKPAWARGMRVTARIGHHVFLKPRS